MINFNERMAQMAARKLEAKKELEPKQTEIQDTRVEPQKVEPMTEEEIHLRRMARGARYLSELLDEARPSQREEVKRKFDSLKPVSLSIQYNRSGGEHTREWIVILRTSEFNLGSLYMARYYDVLLYFLEKYLGTKDFYFSPRGNRIEIMRKGGMQATEDDHGKVSEALAMASRQMDKLFSSQIDLEPLRING